MTIDPMNAPILGDVAPADPPGPVRLAVALLFANVILVAGYRLATAFDTSFPIFLIPLAFATWFALSLRAGRNWARTASTVLSCLLIAMLALLINYGMLDVLTLVLSAALLLTAIRLMWRADVNDYFGP